MTSETTPDLDAGPAPFPGPPAPASRRRTGLVLGGSALALGLVAGGGVALGLRAHSAAPAATSSPWRTSEQVQLPGLRDPYVALPDTVPRTDPGTGSGTDEGTRTATAAQSAGLVEITSTLTGGRAAGTGMVLTPDGTVVTNHHVVQGATSIEVTVLSTGMTYTATYVGGDPSADVAVLRLDGARGLTTVDPDSDGVAVGDEITAVGDANGDGGSLTAAPGTVTAEEQAITVQGDDGTSSRLTGLLQLTSDLVPGDSGGAVLDADGHVVAMNVAASTGGPEVTGYAIPWADVQAVVRAVLGGDDSGDVELGYRGYLGVALDSGSGAPLVAEALPGGPAARAGIGRGARITGLDGARATSVEALRDRLAKLEPGERVRISWTAADGTAHTATVTLGRAPVA